MVLMLAFQAATAQTVNVDDVDVNKGSENTLVVHLKNASNCVATGFILDMPEGSFDNMGSSSGFSLELSQNVANDHVVVSELLSENKLKVAIYSLSNSAFKNGNNGDILLSLKFFGAGCNVGSYKGYLRSVELANSSNKLIRLSDVTFNVTVSESGSRKGDTNGDGDVSLLDVIITIDYILGLNPTGFIFANAELTGDNEISLADLLAIIDIILSNENNGNEGGAEEPTSYLQCPDDHHPHMIDLGLPSGTKWACCNVGADKPEAYGGYYAWGETEEKNVYSWSTYLHCDGTKETCHDIGQNISGTQYDVAHVKWGGSWQMPTVDQIAELIDNSTHEWLTVGGVDGCKIYGTNGGSIFLPANGYRKDTNTNLIGRYSIYWSSLPFSDDSSVANRFSFGTTSTEKNGNIWRYYGQGVRPVVK